MLKPSGRCLISGIISIFILFAESASAQERNSVGLHNSPAGFGLVYSRSLGTDGNVSASLVSDMYGIYSSKSAFPGLCISCVQEKFYRNLESFSLYYSLGGTVGYVRDFEKNSLPWIQAPLEQTYGIMAGVTIGWGMHFFFERNFSIDTGIRAIGGLHFRKNNDALVIDFYKNGLIQALCPVIRIQYSF